MFLFILLYTIFFLLAFLSPCIFLTFYPLFLFLSPGTDTDVYLSIAAPLVIVDHTQFFTWMTLGVSILVLGFVPCHNSRQCMLSGTSRR
jgi:hypothetical protein